MADPTHIRIRNARQHNLRGVDLDVPRNALVVFTGVSGSGKSSLVFDTIHQEGQRRFMDSLSSYALQFLGSMERPLVDAVDGISPTISIDQKTVNRNPRSTVGTITEIYDHLRLLMARLGQPHCPICDAPIDRIGVDQVVGTLLERSEGQKVQVLSPVVADRKGEYRKEMAGLARDGWVRARVDGEMVRLDDPPTLERYEKHTIEVVVDRLVPSEADRPRLVEATETALRMGNQVVTFLVGEDELTFATNRACPKHPDQAVPELEPRLFSFNSPQGACGTCEGLGELQQFELELLVDADKPVLESFLGFNDDGKVPFVGFDGAGLRNVAEQIGAPLDLPIKLWTDHQRDQLVWGDPGIIWSYTKETRQGFEVRRRPWQGLIPLVRRVWHFTKFPFFDRFRSRRPCPDCGGARLNAMSRAVRFRDHGIHELAVQTVAESNLFFEGVELIGDEVLIGDVLLREIRDRLHFLHEVGVGYLSLSRAANTLSGGEAQRIRLASQVGSGLQGITYVLDEPSIGLHPRDNLRLLDAMRRLRDRGNTVLVVEHDSETMLAADHLVEVGPGAGHEGGFVVAAGKPRDFLRSGCTTARYLTGELSIEMPAQRRSIDVPSLKVRGASLHNLHEVDVSIPLGVMTVVTGVSGSGKSTLIFRVMERSLRRLLQGERAVGCRSLDGVEHIDKIIRISQRPIGRTPRSNPATYTGAMDIIRDLFAGTAESRARGYSKSRFSFNVKGGRCEDCSGAGVKTVEMQFLPDVVVPCESCNGRRFNRETLDIRYKGLSIHQVLELSGGDALEVFGRVPKLARILQTLVDVGLDYVTLGQPSTTLSGGEAQRMKLASELHRPSTGRTLYLLDEPTTGLHFQDVAKLLGALQSLVELGNSVLIVEHHTDVIKSADHVIDLGPDGGDGGGRIVGEGTPEHLATLDTPTGRALAELTEFSHTPLMVAELQLAELSVVRPDHIAVRGARKHNLQHIDVDVQHGSLTVITGVSGSGKTSLAFDTIFAEGQRRYVESLSTYARRFLGQVERAPVDLVEGLQPAIAIDQANASSNPRSTVATVTEVHDVLRLLYARIGKPHCPHCGDALAASSPSSVARDLMHRAPGAGWITTYLPPDDDPEQRQRLLVREGWRRIVVTSDEGVREIDLEDEAVQPELARGAELVLDRVAPSRTEASRISEAVVHAYRIGHGRVRFRPRGGGEPILFTEGIVCPTHGIIFTELTPRHFSFNARVGMCPTCEGVGTLSEPQPERLFAGHGPLMKALDPRVASVLKRSARNLALLEAFLEARGQSMRKPVGGWSANLHREVLRGSTDSVEFKFSRRWGRSVQTRTESDAWPGLISLLRGTKQKVAWVTVDVDCPECGGSRLAPGPGAVTLEGLDLGSFSALTVDDALSNVAGWSLHGEAATIAERPVDELQRRLRFLVDVGLGYLSLDRRAGTLSGGESQRIRLASQLGSGFTGVTYVLDEPTVGLHPRDTGRLLDSLVGLRDLGNTVIIVEHDPDTIGLADHIIDMGPGAGRYGGHVLATGTPAEIAANPASLTGRWLSGEDRVDLPATRRKGEGKVVLKGATAHNLQVASVTLPLGVWIAVAGVSGSGKSTLIMDTLAPALQLQINGSGAPLAYRSLETTEKLHGVVVVEQSPIGRSPRSTPATYTGVMDHLRKLYAGTRGSMERGWKAGRFSYNSAGGRCEGCEGRGAVLIEMHFLPDVWVTCSVCRGRRYQADTLEVRWKGHSIADVLALRADEAADLFANQRSIHKRLQALVDVGLGYLTLGQPGTTLSGGEAQRVKLASELVSRAKRRLYVLDEPTTGLHLSDVRTLIGVLHALVDQGHTVITIEHHLDMIASADVVLEMGPAGGDAGGRVIAKGTPARIAKAGTATGEALKAHFARYNRIPATDH